MQNLWKNSTLSDGETALNDLESAYMLGQLGLWILIALKHGPKHMADIRDFIIEHTDGVVAADDRSIYRTLGRYHASGLISFTEVASTRGRSLKVYELTPMGVSTTSSFLKRNIFPLFALESIIRNGIE